MKCIIGRGQLLGRSIEHEAEVAVVIADLWLPACVDHAESFAESQDRAIAVAPPGQEGSYRKSFRLARLDEMPPSAPRFERAGPIAPRPLYRSLRHLRSLLGRLSGARRVRVRQQDTASR